MPVISIKQYYIFINKLLTSVKKQKKNSKMEINKLFTQKTPTPSIKITIKIKIVWFKK